MSTDCLFGAAMKYIETGEVLCGPITEAPADDIGGDVTDEVVADGAPAAVVEHLEAAFSAPSQSD